MKDKKFLQRALVTHDADTKAKRIDSIILSYVDNILPLGSLKNENAIINSEIKQAYDFLKSL